MEEKFEGKLNTKRTFYVGLAFFTILMMWQIYNSYCPLFLDSLFQKNYGAGNYKYLIGIIMAADNLLALFMLPLFGALSDKTKSKMGKRMPYIIAGTLCTIILFPFIPFLYIKNSVAGVAVLMALVLVSMNVYRNPAVSLMPDMTPKPLRSKANAIINFVGYLGAIFAGILAMFFKYDSNNVVWPFVITSIFMLLALIILVLKIRENKIETQMRAEMEKGEKFSEAVDAVKEDAPITPANKRNLILLIVSVFLWFFAFNAVETFWTTYSENFLGISTWSLATIVLTVSSLIAFLPSSYLTRKMGRKNVIILGLGLLIAGLIGATFIGMYMPKFTGNTPWQFYMLIIMFAFSGVGWAFVNVNSYPMVVEMANKSSVGKYTGYYYTSSMVAQSLTPMIIGFIMDGLGYNMFFPYATIFMALALAVFCFVRTKKPLIEAKDSSLEEAEKPKKTRKTVEK